MKEMLIGLVALSALLLSACASGGENADTSQSTTEQSSSEDISWAAGEEYSSPFTKDSTEESAPMESAKIYGLNEEAILEDSSGNKLYSLKILKATTALSETDEAYTNGKPENTIEVTYEYKNYGMDTPMQLRAQFLQAFDMNGSGGESTSMVDGQNEVAVGRSSKSTTWFVMNEPMKNSEEVEIDYVNDFALGFEGSMTFRVPLEH